MAKHNSSLIGIRPRRDFAALEERRMQAATLFRTGFGPAEVGRQLGVSCMSASRWYRAWQQEGVRGLRAAGRAGRRPRLDARQWRRVERALLKGPLAFGYGSELWTLERVAAVIEQVSGVRSPRPKSACSCSDATSPLGQLPLLRGADARSKCPFNGDRSGLTLMLHTGVQQWQQRRR